MTPENPPGDDREALRLAGELRPYVDRTEIAELGEIAARLEASRPLPRAAFRAELRAHLGELAARRPRRPERLRLMIAAYAGSGLTVLLVTALGVGGSGVLGY